MTQEAISNLIARGEGPTVEFKRSLTKDVGRELCAFANAGGGTILIGVSDAGEVVGVADHNRLKSRVQSTARSADPAIELAVESVGIVLRVVVPPQRHKPYSFGGRFFTRIGANSQQMSNAEVEDLFYAVGRLHFDKTPCAGFSVEKDLDAETWAQFSDSAKVPDAMDRIVALRNLGLLDGEDRMTHAGAWLLAHDIRRFTTSAHVSCALFIGTEKVRILDRRDFHRDIPTMIDDVVAWMLTKINVEFIIKHVRREERPELPEEALREAVANAVTHRDYRSTANVHIYVFKDRIEIVSPGGLPAGMTEADLGVKSMPRNPLLFGMLYRMGVVENIGSGIKRIHELCREHGVAKPTIDVSEHWVTVTFPRPAGQVKTEHMAGVSEKRGRISDAVGDKLEAETESGPTGTKSAPRRHLAGTQSAPSRHQVEILHNCLSEKAISELMPLTGRSDRTKFRNQVLKPLLESGWLEMTVPDKPNSSKQKYRLTAGGKALLAKLDRVRE